MAYAIPEIEGIIKKISIFPPLQPIDINTIIHVISALMKVFNLKPFF